MAGIKFTVSVPGLRQLGATYQNAAAVLLPKAIHDALEPVAEETLADAKSKAPKRTGALAGSLKLAQGGATFWRIGPSRAKYFNAVHWGTGPRAGRRGPHNIRGVPFLFQAGQDAQPKATAAAQAAITKLIEDLQ